MSDESDNQSRDTETASNHVTEGSAPRIQDNDIDSGSTNLTNMSSGNDNNETQQTASENILPVLRRSQRIRKPKVPFDV